jgi:uncharacterized protein (TIGR02217 family)
MQFVDVPFPDCIAFGATFDPVWSTTVVPVIGGQESTNENWEDAKHNFEISFAARPVSDYQALRAHFHEVRGRANSFPVKDYLDFQVTTSQGRLLSSAGAAPSANGTYNLHKRYGSTNPYDRRITRPDTPIQVFRTRASVTTDITGAGAAVTYAGGTVAITGHASGDTYTWSGTFKVPSRYDVDRLPSAVINKSDDELVVDCGPVPVVEVFE